MANDDFDAWIMAVNQALKSSHRGFTTATIDPSALMAAFGANASPAIFARSVHPLPAQPVAIHDSPIQPSKWGCVAVHGILSVGGFFCWVIALTWFVMMIQTARQPASGPADLAGVKASVLMFQAVIGVGLVLIGTGFHWMAQMLALSWSIHQKAGKP